MFGDCLTDIEGASHTMLADEHVVKFDNFGLSSLEGKFALEIFVKMVAISKCG